MDINTQLKERNLPNLLSREEMKDILQREEYGYLPSVDFTMSVSEPTYVYGEFMCGNVEHSYVTMTISANGGSHSFRVDRVLHKDGKKRPLVIFNNFHPIYASRYYPFEEICEREVDVISCVYTDVTSDNGDFSNGLAPLLLPDGQNTDTSCGKIGIWAWANMRLLDYGLTLEGTDKENIGVIGHSRLGKTALFTGMMDERFKFVYSNAAGCAGDAIARGNSGLSGNLERRDRGELISDIYRTFPFWFCKNYKKYTDTNIPDGFDQHYLLATIAPRYVLIGSCDLDLWADPVSQQLCALAASEAWDKMGIEGLKDCTRFLNAGEDLCDGHVGFFLLNSRHLLSRHGWKRFIDFIEKNK